MDPADPGPFALPADLDPFLRRQLEAYPLLQAGRYGEALAAYDELIGLLGREDRLQDLAGVLLCRAQALDGLGRDEEALAAREDVVRRCGAAGGSLAGLVAVARYEIGLGLIRAAKRAWADGGAPAAAPLLERAVAALHAGSERHPDMPWLPLLLGYTHFLAGRRAEGLALLTEAERRAGDVQPLVLTLLAVAPVPPDDELRAAWPAAARARAAVGGGEGGHCAYHGHGRCACAR